MQTGLALHTMNKPAKPRFNRFQLLAKLGSGLHGRVYLAWDPQLERKVALKVLTQRRPNTADLAEFLGEARSAARIAHPNVIPIFEAGSEQGAPFLVLEYVRGRSLRQSLAGVTLDHPAAAHMFEQILQGVAAAHEQGVAHLDLSPNNILVDDRNRLRVMDFGLARFAAESAAHAAQEIQGTPRYMSPEHFAGRPLDLRTDVFALGLMFYELLAGTPAVQATNYAGLTKQITQASFDWGVLHQRAVPIELQAVVRDALQLKPAHRFASAVDMLAALRDAQAVLNARDNQEIAVQFLLRRLQRRPEFPAFSNSIAEINRLTADNSNSGATELSAVVMRDFSLTNRLLKIANSASFARGDVGVTNVVQAITRVGTKTVRMICNGLLMFEHLKTDNPLLRDALVGSFVAALLARDLTAFLKPELTEEAFVAAMFNRLGRNLLIYYLPEEYAEIEHRIARGTLSLQAEREVLGTTNFAVGAAIAASWKFPPALVAGMAALPTGILSAPRSSSEYAQYFAHFPNELCDVATHSHPGAASAELARLSTRFGSFVKTTPPVLAEVLQLAMEKFAELAPSLGVGVATSGFCHRVQHFLASYAAEQAAAEPQEAPLCN